MHLDIIVPVKNEAENLALLVPRIDKALRFSGIKYKIIVIDDHSTDSTIQVLEELKWWYPLEYYSKQGKQGKAYSILEGAEHSRGDYLAMIDGDLQYPPEAIPKMVKLLKEKNLGVVVARRKLVKTSVVRRAVSWTFCTIFGEVLHGFKLDVQSGLKVFQKELINCIDSAEVTPWTLDLTLLLVARELGYSCGEVNINFDKRPNGKSKVNLLKSSWEIGSNAVRLRLRRKHTLTIKPTETDSMIGAGFVHWRQKLITHTGLSTTESALQTFVNWQKGLLGILIILFGMGIILRPWTTAQVVVAMLSLIYFLDTSFSLYLIIKSLNAPEVGDYPLKNVSGKGRKRLPVYSILCPLYKEAKMLPLFVQSIKKLKWPKSKLDVLLLLEEDDQETIAVCSRLKLPAYFRTVIVPNSQPKTKPKACNFGLAKAKGEYLVVYDAEDRPDLDQLQIAYRAFQEVPEDVVCLQAKLNYYNPYQNILTRLFTAEYSLWFDLILTGLHSLKTIIPLGGTSNHFKKEALVSLQGWDPFNVTEDCDLGVRLFKKGYRTAMINSTTLEEANSRPKNWLRQRSRWIKGYMQTYLVHMRHPLAFLKHQGSHVFIFQLVIGARMVFMIINPVLWAATISYFALHHLVGPAIESLYPTPVFYTAVASLVFGNFMHLYNYMIGCAKRGQWGLVKFVYLVPCYWFMASVASTIAFYQLLVKPHYWEKTIHGFHLNVAPQTSLANKLFSKPAFASFRSMLAELFF